MFVGHTLVPLATPFCSSLSAYRGATTMTHKPRTTTSTRLRLTSFHHSVLLVWPDHRSSRHPTSRELRLTQPAQTQARVSPKLGRNRIRAGRVPCDRRNVSATFGPRPATTLRLEIRPAPGISSALVVAAWRSDR